MDKAKHSWNRKRFKNILNTHSQRQYVWGKKHIEDLIKLLQYIEGTLYRALLQYSTSL